MVRFAPEEGYKSEESRRVRPEEYDAKIEDGDRLRYGERGATGGRRRAILGNRDRPRQSRMERKWSRLGFRWRSVTSLETQTR